MSQETITLTEQELIEWLKVGLHLVIEAQKLTMRGINPFPVATPSEPEQESEQTRMFRELITRSPESANAIIDQAIKEFQRELLLTMFEVAPDTAPHSPTPFDALIHFAHGIDFDHANAETVNRVFDALHFTLPKPTELM